MADATIVIDADKIQVDRTLADIESDMRRWGGNVKNIIIGAFSYYGIRKALGWAQDLVGLANDQADAEAKLQAVLTATGNAAGFTAEQLGEQAAGYQKLTTYGDEVISNAQAILATFREIKGDQFIQATEAALNMSAVLGGDLQQSAIQLGKALNDPVQGVGALSRAGVSFSEAQKETIKTLAESGKLMEAQSIVLKELEVEFGGAAEAAAKAGSGPFKQFQNAAGDVGETFGNVLTAVLGPFGQWLVEIMPVVQNFADALVEATSFATQGIADFTERSTGYIEGFFDFMLQAFTGAQTLFTNWGSAGTIALDTIMLSFEIWKNRTIHFFTEVLPGLFSWFTENWRDVFQSAFDWVATIFSNMWENVKSFFDALTSYLAGEGFDWEWRGLTEGFESSIKKLPEIAERELSDLEIELADRIAENSKSLTEKYQKNLELNRAALGLDESGNLLTNPFEFKGAPEIQDVPITGGGDDDKKKKAAPQFEDLQALNKRISSAGQKTDEKIEENTKKSAKALENIDKNIGELNRRPRGAVYQ